MLEDETFGVYCEYSPPHILILENVISPLGILVHELTHHLVAHYYTYEGEFSQHGYPFQLAKPRVIKWCYKNISQKPDWSLPLKAYQTTINMRKFRV